MLIIELRQKLKTISAFAKASKVLQRHGYSGGRVRVLVTQVIKRVKHSAWFQDMRLPPFEYSVIASCCAGNDPGVLNRLEG